MKKLIISVTALFAIASSAFSQQIFRSTYFLEGYNQRHEFNPAFASNTSYFALPIMGGFNLESQSNLGVNTFIYPVDGKLTTFMNSAVPADKFLGKLDKMNQIAVNNNISLFSLGIKKEKSFYTFDINLKTEGNINLPYSLFDFMKNAGNSQHYDISGLSLQCRSRAELGFGYSRSITDRLRVGGRLKFLVGLSSFEADIKKMNVQMTEDRWSIKSKGILKSSSVLEFQTKGETGAKIDDPSESDLLDFSKIKKDWGSLLNGFGAAIDLGAEMEVIQGLKVSLAINDLGFMGWKNATIAQTSGKGWIFDGFNNVSMDGGNDDSLDGQVDDLTDDMFDMFDFRITGKNKTNCKMLSATINAGAEYTMPFYSGLSAGLTGTSYINGAYSWTEGRLFVNVKPTRWFSASVNGAMSKFGPTFGAVIGFHVTGFNIFIGSDHIQFDYAKAYRNLYYPYGKMNFNLNFGISFNLGRNRK